MNLDHFLQWMKASGVPDNLHLPYRHAAAAFLAAEGARRDLAGAIENTLRHEEAKGTLPAKVAHLRAAGDALLQYARATGAAPPPAAAKTAPAAAPQPKAANQAPAIPSVPAPAILGLGRACIRCGTATHLEGGQASKAANTVAATLAVGAGFLAGFLGGAAFGLALIGVGRFYSALTSSYRCPSCGTDVPQSALSTSEAEAVGSKRTGLWIQGALLLVGAAVVGVLWLKLAVAMHAPK